MAFPTTLKRQLFAHLTERADTFGKCPSLRLIAKIARLRGEDEASALLRDMQTDGVIKILREGEYPWVSLLRHSYNGPLVEGRTLDPEKWGDRSLAVTGAAPVPVQAAPIQLPVYVPMVPVAMARMALVPTLRKVAPVIRDEAKNLIPVLPLAGKNPPVIDKATQFNCGHPRTPENSTRNNTTMRCRQCKLAQQGTIKAAQRLASGVTVRTKPPLAMIPMSTILFGCGHPRSPDNQVRKGGDKVGCKRCQNDRQQRNRAAQPAKVPPVKVDKRQVNISVPVAIYDTIVAAAKVRGVSIATVTGEIFNRGCETPVKPRIPANVMAAYLASGRPFAEFFGDVLMLGVEAMGSLRIAAE